MDVPNNLQEFSNLALVDRNFMLQDIALVDSTSMTKSSHQDLKALVEEIKKADDFIKTSTCNTLEVIREQIRCLQRKAQNILLEAKRNIDLNHVACNFVKQPGHIYHLYERESGQLYFSMLSPEEWGNSVPLQCYKGSFKLEQNYSWTSLSETHPEMN